MDLNKVAAYKDLAFVFVGRGSSAMGGLLLTFVIANRFTIDETGRFMLAFALLMTAGFAGRFGLDVLAVKELPEVRHDKAARNRLIVRFLGLSFLLAGGLTCFIGVLAFGLKLEVAGLATLGIIPFAIINLQGAILRALGHTRVGAFCEAGLSTVFAALAIFIWFETNLHVAWWYVCLFSWFQMLLVFGFMLRYDLLSWNKRFRFREIWNKTRPFGLIQIASNLAQWGSLYLIAILATHADVALANALFRFVAPFQFLFLTLDFYLGPKFATRLATSKSNAIENSTLFTIRRFGIHVALVLSLLLLAALTFAGSPLLSIFFPSNYAGLFWPLMLLFFAHALVLGLGQNGLLLSLSGHVDLVLKATLIRASLGLVALAGLISVFHIWAVAFVYSFAIILEAVYFRLKVGKIYDNQS